jgi:hypothetical protein
MAIFLFQFSKWLQIGLKEHVDLFHLKRIKAIF